MPIPKSCIDQKTATPLCLSLSAEERSIFQDFFLAMLASSECGYVLYGNKPICFMSLAAPGNDPVGTLGHRLSVDLYNGMSLWKTLGLPQQSSDFILHIYNHDDHEKSEWTQLLLINRKAFYKAVNENLSLFQYILGVCVTPELLLEKILDPRENFFSVLKDNKVLIGIVLGFGTNNALYVNRLELIQEYLNESGETPTSLTHSFGYNTLQEEYQDLEAKIFLSSKFLELETPRLFFGCLPSTTETKFLINDYERAQLEIVEILESPEFLEKVFKKFFCNERFNLENNKKNLSTFNFYSDDLILRNRFINHDLQFDWSRLVAYTISQEFALWSKSIEGGHFFFKFIEGMEAANKKEDALYEAFLTNLDWSHLSNEERDYHKGFMVWSHFKPANKLYSINSVHNVIFKELQNSSLSTDEKETLHHATQKLHRYLYQLHQNEEIQKANKKFKELDAAYKVIKNRVYYIPLIQGSGKFILQNDRVKLRYCIKSSQGHVLKSTQDEVEEIDLQRTIYGLRKGLVGLQEGSQGILYVHPKYGFRDIWNLPSIKLFLIIEFEIIDSIVS